MIVTGGNLQELNIDEVLKYLPHRYPFLMLDRVLEVERGIRLKAIKNVTYNEPFFQGHFPVKPVFPGVLIIESIAQATALLSFHSQGRYPADDELYLLVGIDNARFKRQVVPGDQLVVEVSVIRSKRGFWRYQCEARVDGELACSTEILSALKKVEI
jgi:3-hydroxyacyl-[acyl-carrier-protein] dehydratase